MSSIAGRIQLSTLPDSDKRVVLLPWQKRGLSYTASGYGRKIPTTRQVRVNGRWRRVYCCIFSNSGTLYIEQGKTNDWIVVEE